jgi:hypothetical protein
MIAALLCGEGKLNQRVLRNEDVLRAVDLVRESYSASANFTSGTQSWALLQARYPDEAAALARTWLASEREELLGQISAKVAPFLATSQLRAYWKARMRDQGEAARAILAEAQSRGIPLPITAP